MCLFRSVLSRNDLSTQIVQGKPFFRLAAGSVGVGVQNLSHLLGWGVPSVTKEEGEVSTDEAATEIVFVEPGRVERLKLAEVGDEEAPAQVGIDPMSFFFCASMKKEICVSVEPVLRRCSTILSVMEQMLLLRM